MLRCSSPVVNHIIKYIFSYLSLFKNTKYIKSYTFTVCIMKKPISATIEEDLIAWIDKIVAKDRKKYRNKSHLIEIALERLREEER